MKCKNIFFGLCASMVIASEISAMQLVTKRVPKSMHQINIMGPMLQKRKYYEEAGGIVAGAMMILPVAYLIGPVAGVMYCITISALCEGSHRVYNATKYAINPKKFTANTLYDQVAAIGSERCSTAYIKREECQNPCCCKHLDQYNTHNKRVELFYDINQEHAFLIDVKYGLQRLRSKKEEAKLLFIHNKIDAQGYAKVIGLLEHKKDCYIKQHALFDGYKDQYELILKE